MNKDIMRAIDEAPVTSFHRKLLVGASGGPFLDGYILSMIGVAMMGISEEMSLTTSQMGLLGASSFIGMFLGAIIFGNMTDRVGREKMYLIDLLVMIVGCILCALAGSFWQIIALRVIIGVAIAADYPIATSLLTEFTPSKRRGFMIGVSAIAWYLGAIAAFAVGALLVHFGGYDTWRWMFASAAVVGVIVFLLRRGIPESPRWLYKMGRIKEANSIMKKVYGVELDLSKVTDQKKIKWSESIKILAKPSYAKLVAMCGIMYLAFITPMFAIYTFGPSILQGFGLNSPTLSILGEAGITILFVTGCLLVINKLDTIGRRNLTVWSFLAMSVPLFALSLWSDGPMWFVVLAFSLYALVSGGPGITQWAYPNELFPTEVRATAVGLAIAISRVGAGIGVYILPVSMEKWGVSGVMLAGGVISLVGWLVCLAWAPETKNKTLEEASSY